jgi:hypothetical protein
VASLPAQHRREVEAHAIVLPTERVTTGGDWSTKKLLVYGPQKVGKSTLAAELDPDNSLFILTEPGADHLSIKPVPCGSWEDFLKIGQALQGAIRDLGRPPYKFIVVDTVDELARMCGASVLTHLAEGTKDMDPKGVLHASDFEYGKGWEAEAEEFRKRIARLCNLGMGVVFISHEKEAQVTLPNGATVNMLSPDVGHKQMRKWLLGYVDFIFHAEVAASGHQLRRAPPPRSMPAAGCRAASSSRRRSRWRPTPGARCWRRWRERCSPLHRGLGALPHGVGDHRQRGWRRLSCHRQAGAVVKTQRITGDAGMFFAVAVPSESYRAHVGAHREGPEHARLRRRPPDRRGHHPRRSTGRARLGTVPRRAGRFAAAAQGGVGHAA